MVIPNVFGSSRQNRQISYLGYHEGVEDIILVRLGTGDRQIVA